MFSLIIIYYWIISFGCTKKFKESYKSYDNLCEFFFKDLNADKTTPKEYFKNTYVEEVYESKNICTSTKQFLTDLYNKWKK